MYANADPALTNGHELGLEGFAMGSARALDREEHMVSIAADEQEHGFTQESPPSAGEQPGGFLADV